MSALITREGDDSRLMVMRSVYYVFNPWKGINIRRFKGNKRAIIFFQKLLYHGDAVPLYLRNLHRGKISPLIRGNMKHVIIIVGQLCALFQSIQTALILSSQLPALGLGRT